MSGKEESDRITDKNWSSAASATDGHFFYASETIFRFAVLTERHCRDNFFTESLNRPPQLSFMSAHRSGECSGEDCLQPDYPIIHHILSFLEQTLQNRVVYCHSIPGHPATRRDCWKLSRLRASKSTYRHESLSLLELRNSKSQSVRDPASFSFCEILRLGQAKNPKQLGFS